MREMFETEKRPKIVVDQKWVSDLLGALILKKAFALILFPWSVIIISIKTIKLTIAFFKMLKQRRVYKNSPNARRYANVPHKRTWTNPEFLTEAEKERYMKTRFFFPEG